MRDDKFDRLYAEHAQGLFGFLVYRTGNRALAEDLLADTFERAIRGRRGFDRRKATEKIWLYAIALSILRDYGRRRGAEWVAMLPPLQDPVAPHRVDQHDKLGAALAALSPGEREAIALRYGADLTVREVAKLTNEGLTTVEGRVYRALGKLRDMLA